MRSAFKTIKMETQTKHSILSDSHLFLMQESHSNYTVDLLAKDIKRSKKTIYKCFGSKLSLIKAVFTIHQNYIRTQFDEVDRNNVPNIDKLIKYIYLVDESIKEIRLSRWYHQAKRYVKLKEVYFELRTQVYEAHLIDGLRPYEEKLFQHQKPLIALTNFIISSLEFNYFHRSALAIKNNRPNEYVDQLVFMLHGCLIGIEDV